MWSRESESKGVVLHLVLELELERKRVVFFAVMELESESNRLRNRSPIPESEPNR